jgi:hypothetical protein
MLIKYFNSNRAELLLLFPAIALLIWLSSLINHPIALVTDLDYAGPIGRLLVSLVPEVPHLSSALALVILFLYGYLLVQLNIKYFFLKTRSQLPQLFYITITGVLFYLRFLSTAMLATFFIIAITYRLFESFKKEKIAINFLDAGIFMAFAVLFYVPYLFVFPIIYVALLSFRNFIWQEWVYPVIGFCLPFIFWGSYLFMTDQSLNLIFIEFQKIFSGPNHVYDFSLLQIVFYGYIAFLVVIGSIHMILTIGTRKIQSRKFFIFFLCLFVLSLIVVILIPSAGIEVIYTIGISLAFLLSNYFTTCRNTRVNNILLGLFIAGILVVIADDWLNIVQIRFSY